MPTLQAIEAEIQRLTEEREARMAPLDAFAVQAYSAHQKAHPSLRRFTWGEADYRKLDADTRNAWRAVVVALRPDIAPE